MIEIVYYAHGATDDNESGLASGWDQISLSENGIKQTIKASQQIDSNECEAIFASDLTRAIESAEILFPDRKDEIIVDIRLRECNYGSLTKKPNHKLVYAEHIDTPFPYGESLKDVESRMRDFLKELEVKNYRKIAIVSHRVPQLALEVIVLNYTWKDAIVNDWRVCGGWKPGWRYVY